MDLWTLLETIVGGAVGTSAVVFGLSRHLGDRLLEGVKAQHNKELAEMQNAFSMGASSHMATVAFDNYVGFCKEYVEEISKALYTMIQQGPTYKPPNATEFSRIRQKWALWLTQDIEAKLDRFEDDAARMGADGQYFDADGAPESNERNVKLTIVYLRNTLAVEELTALRKELARRSSQQSPHVA